MIYPSYQANNHDLHMYMSKKKRDCKCTTADKRLTYIYISILDFYSWKFPDVPVVWLPSWDGWRNFPCSHVTWSWLSKKKRKLYFPSGKNHAFRICFVLILSAKNLSIVLHSPLSWTIVQVGNGIPRTDMIIQLYCIILFLLSFECFVTMEWFSQLCHKKWYNHDNHIFAYVIMK